MLGGRDVYDGIETMYGPNWQNLGQKSSVDFGDASAAAAAGIREGCGCGVCRDFLPHSRQRLARPLFVRRAR